jgi:hypothetical protein
MNYITADMAMDHALIAKAITDRKLLETKYVMGHNINHYHWSQMSQDDVLSSLGSIVLEITKHVFKLVTEKSVETQYTMGKIMGCVKEWLADPAWYELSESISFDEVKKMNIITVRHDVADVGSAVVCEHHTSTCKHDVVLTQNYCMCCGLYPKEKESNFCSCCTQDHCHHRCRHVCTGKIDHILGTGAIVQTCECCGINYDTNVCNVCHKPDGFDIITDVEIAARVREAEKLEKQRKELEKQSKTQGKMTATEQETTAGELEPTDTTKEIKLTEDNKKNEGQPKKLN